MSLTFYYTPMSSATRVHWALEELGLSYEKVKLDLGAGDQKKPEYLALNPNGCVPLLVVDGTPIFESLAILLYLGERWGVDKGLYPSLSIERAEALKWMVWGQATLIEAASRILRNVSDRYPAEQRNDKAGEAARQDVGKLCGILDKALEGKEYMLGGGFTLVDLALVAYLPFLARFNIDLGPHKNVQAWSARCMARPALGRVMSGQA
jgi:glutathione S-transferase